MSKCDPDARFIQTSLSRRLVSQSSVHDQRLLDLDPTAHRDFKTDGNCVYREILPSNLNNYNNFLYSLTLRYYYFTVTALIVRDGNLAAMIGVP